MMSNTIGIAAASINLRTRHVSRTTRHVGAWTSGIPLLVAAAALAWLAASPSSLSLPLYAAAAQEVDTDGDTMPDEWEAFFGLDPNDPTDADGDPDGDGLTNAQEYAARRHPVGRHARYFAEGSTGYFDTSVAVLNLSPTDSAHVAIALLAEGGGVVSHQVRLGPRQRQTISINEVLRVAAAVALIVESDVPVAADRGMTWGPDGVGASLDSGAPGPATVWYFAEGATGPFLLYYLFENPATTPATVTVRYLIEGAPAVTTTRVLPPQSRTTVFVNAEDPALAIASVGSVVTSDVPIFTERAMYVNAGGAFGGGSASAGSAHLSTQWYFGEGATGPFFQAFLSLLNPGSTAATATVTWHLNDGSTASKAYEVPAAGRRTVYFNGEAATDPALAALATGPVWFTVSATEPILGERAMWWADWPWYEGHAAPGATASSVAWAVPEGRHGGPAFDQTYVLVGNTTAAPGQVRLTVIPDSGAASGQEVPIGAHERLTLNVGSLFGLTSSRFSVIVESLGTPATPLVVDYARYHSVNGIPFSGGGAAPAVPLPSVLSRNHAPTFTAGASQTVPEDAGPQTVAGWAAAISPGPAHEAGQAITFLVTGNTHPGLFSQAPVVSADGALSYTPAPNAYGAAIITLVAQDDGGTTDGGVDTSAPTTLVITVTARNDPPTFVSGGDRTVNEDSGPVSFPNWATEIGPGATNETDQAVVFLVTGNTNPGLFLAPPAVSTAGTLTFTPADNASGSATITLVARDNGGTDNGGADTSAPVSFAITVASVNDPPVALADSYAVQPHGAVSVAAPGVLANDTDQDTPTASLIVTLVAGPSDASFFALNANGSFTYVHDGSVSAIDNFTYRVSDGAADSNVVTVTLIVTSGPLETEPNDSAANATALTGSNLKVTGSLFPAGDVDYYSFTAQAGDRVYAAVMTAASTSGSTDSVLTLLASDGSTVLETDDDDGSFSRLSSTIAGATIPLSGTYYLQVAPFAANIPVYPYDLWIQVRNGAPMAETEPNDAIPGQPLPASAWVSGEVTSDTDVDYYAVTLNAGDSVFASLDLDPERDGVQWNALIGLSPFGDPAVTLSVDDAGPSLPSSEAFFLTVKDAGTYYLMVRKSPGVITSFGTYHLSVSVLPAATLPSTTYTSTDVPVAIPTGPGMVTSTITIPDAVRIGQLKVAIDLTHNAMADLDVSLTSPDGNTVALFTDIGSGAPGGQTRMNLILDDTAAFPIGFYTVVSGLVVMPESIRLEWFKGQQAQGTWTLTIRDDRAQDGGTLNGWRLIVVEDAPLPEGAPRTIFSTDFEADDGGFTHAGTEDEWEWGAPTFAPVDTAHSGVNAWKTDLDDTYNASSIQDLYSPEIDVTDVASGAVLLEWAMKFQLENAHFDSAFVEVQEVGGGGRARKVWQWLGPDMRIGVGNPQIFIEESAGWGRYRAIVTDFIGKTIRLRFHLQSDDSVQYAGLAIDDVSVTAFEH